MTARLYVHSPNIAPSLRCIGRLQRFVLIKNGRSWRKHLSMSVSRGRSSKDTSLFATPRRDGKWLPLLEGRKNLIFAWSHAAVTRKPAVDLFTTSTVSSERKP